MKKLHWIVAIGIIGVLLGSVLPHKYGGLWYGQYLTLLLLTYLVPVYLLWKFNKYLSIFLLTCVLSSFFVANISPRAVVILTQLEAMCLLSWGISYLNQKQRNIIRYAFLVVFLLQVMILSLQFLNKDPFFDSLVDKSKDMTVGFMGAVDQLGAVQSIISPILAGINWFLIIPALIVIFISKSFFATVAFFTSILILLFFNFRKYIKYGLVFTVILGVIYVTKVDVVNKTQMITRLSPWIYAVKSVSTGNILIIKNGQTQILKTNPLYGYGFGNFMSIFPYVPQQPDFNYVNEKFTHAHNDFIETGLFEMGFVGMAVMFLLVFSFIMGFIESKKNKELIIYFCCIVAYLIDATGNFVSQIAVTGFYLAVIYGMYEGIRRELNGKNTALAQGAENFM